MKKYRRFLDGALILLGLAIVILLLLAPPATTPRMPRDDLHRALAETSLGQGKKAAEKHCTNCHNPVNIPFSEDHPAGSRCLFCHRLPAEAK
jgi:hypothetical protein